MNDIVLVEKEKLENTPSQKKNIDKKTETQLRIYGCQLIQQAGRILNLKIVAVVTSQILFHRFYFKKSFTDFDVKIIAAASLYLACKLEETPCRIYKLITVFHFLYKYEDIKCRHYYFDVKKAKMDHFRIDIESETYYNIKVNIFTYELLILKEIGFIIHRINQHPHVFIFPYLQSLFNNIHLNINSNFLKKITNICWGFLNDSMRTTLCCEYQPKCIAVASIFLAAYKLNIPLIKNTEWYKLYDVEYHELKKICIRILQLYKIGRCSYIDVLKK